MSTTSSEETAAASLIDAYLSLGPKWTADKRVIHDQIADLVRARGILHHCGYIYRPASGRSFSREPDRQQQAPRKGPVPAIGGVIAGKVAARRKRVG